MVRETVSAEGMLQASICYKCQCGTHIKNVCILIDATDKLIQKSEFVVYDYFPNYGSFYLKY